MTTTLSPTLRKAALLVRSLDADSAAVLLAQLSTDEARAVRRAIRELGEIDPLEQEELRTALQSQSKVVDPIDDNAGVELVFSADLPDYQESDHERRTLPALPPSPTMATDNTPFAWLEGGDLPSLAAMLEREHLSTVAVVLSYLPADRAGEVLAALPPGRRAAAIERLADLGESDRASLDVIERELADWIASQKAERQRRAGRLQTIQAILRHSSPTTCESVLAEIATRDELLAHEIGKVRATATGPSVTRPPTRLGGEQAAALKQPFPKPKPNRSPEKKPAEPARPQRHNALSPPVIRFSFERLVELNGRQLAELFRNCPSELVVLALAGASQHVTQHIERLLPRSVVKELHRRMFALSSVRLSDFTAAQDEVAVTAGRLFGEILGQK